MRVRVLLAAVALPLALWAFLPPSSSGQSKQQELSKLQQRIDAARKTIGSKKGTERELRADIAGYQRRIQRLQGKIGTLASRQQVIQADLDDKRSELERVQADLRSQRARLLRLRNRYAETRRMLRIRLIEIYKAGKPDLVTVVLNSEGFADLLERGEFIARISDQDRKIVTLVSAAKIDSTRSEKRLDKLEARRKRVTAVVQRRRDQIAEIKQELIGTRVGYSRTKDGKAAALTKTRTDRSRLQGHVDDLESASAKITSQLNAAQQQNAGDLPIRQGSGRMIYPVNGPITGAFGEQRPGHIHAGMDIAATEGTPIRAADSGRVVLIQGTGASGGYGNYSCVQHTATLSSCYAHQVRFGTSLGANVTKGQVIGYVGNTGNSFGAHLHFETRVNGVPVQPLNYL
ncbi:MAG: peptidoglycan DD-metalloendopeptidase family protein [Solirubrobacteraceae bacterium]